MKDTLSTRFIFFDHDSGLRRVLTIKNILKLMNEEEFHSPAYQRYTLKDWREGWEHGFGYDWEILGRVK